MGTMADLLFRIAGDDTQAQEVLADFRASLLATAASSKTASASILYDWAGNPIQTLGPQFTAMGTAAEGAAARTVASTGAARMAIRGLGTEMGVTMPRFVGSWLASLGPVSGIMSAAFAPIAIIGLVEIFGKLPGAIRSGVLALEGFGEAQRKVFDEGIKQGIAREEYILEYARRIREISLIGKEGIDRINESLLVQSGNFEDVDNLLLKYIARQQELKKITEYKNTPAERGDPYGLGGGMSMATPAGDPNAPSLADIEKARAELAQVEPEILKLQKMLQDLRADDMTTAAQAKADGAAEAARRASASASNTADLMRRLLQEKEQTLEVKREEWNADIAGLRAKMAKEAGVTAEQDAMLEELRKEHLDKLQQEDDAARAKEADSLAAHMARMSAEFIAGLVKDAAARTEAANKARQASDELLTRLARENAETVEGKKAACNQDMDTLRDHYAAINQLTAENASLIERLRSATLAKIDVEAVIAAQTELARLGEERQRIERTYETSEQRIGAQYAADVSKFSAAEERKTYALATSNEQRIAILQQFAAIRAALLGREQAELQALHNSQGWQGIFGSEFAASIKRNEALSKEWADSQAQSHMAVRVSLESLKEMAQDTFGEMAKGEATAIMGAIVYSKNVKQAMEEAAKGVLASLASQAAVKAIFSLAEGLAMAATGDEAGAGQEFAAAALYGSVAAAAAIAGRAIPGGQGGGAGASGGSGASRGYSGAGASGGSGSPQGTAANPGGHSVVVNVQGHLVGWAHINELTGAINDAVLNGDSQLTATNTKTGVQVTQ
jgi:hypothetical protein